MATVLNTAAFPGPNESEGTRPSNQRFRSFAERYVVERCRLWPADGDIDKLAWETVNQARTVYNMIKERGRSLGDDT